MQLKVENNQDIDLRIDLYIKKNSDMSRNHIANLIQNQYVTLNGNVITKPSIKLKLDDVICIKEVEQKPLDVKGENIPLDIIYEDADILIVNKDRGIVVHPANGHSSGTLVNAIMYHCKESLSGINGILRPGIVHRIDKDTSGILCICKNDYSHNDIAMQFKNHTNVRKYKLIVKGNISCDEGIIDEPIGRDKKNRLRYAISRDGKTAITLYKVLKRFNGYTYLECELKTGRTHQIRVHMKSIGHPILGDLLYGNADKNFSKLNGQVLHAYYLEFDHPRTLERLKFECDIPEYFKKILDKLGKF